MVGSALEYGTRTDVFDGPSGNITVAFLISVFISPPNESLTKTYFSEAVPAATA